MLINKSTVRKFFASTSLILLAIIFVIGCTNQNSSKEIQSYYIAPEDQKTIALNLETNERVDLIVEVVESNRSDSTPPESNNIGISVTGPDGQSVVEYTRFGRGEFMVLAERAGRYTVILDNSYEIKFPKTVTFTLNHGG